MKARQEASALDVGADESDRAGAAAERRDIVRRVPCAAGDDRRRVVFEDQHRRFARDARDFAVDEFVRDQITDDEHPAAREAVDEPEQALFPLGLSRQRMDRSRYQHL